MKLSPKQTAALLLDDEEAFYGGAAGGGKSVWLLLAAAQYVDVPHYAALLLRRTHPELVRAGGLIPLAHQFFGSIPGAVWSEGKTRWTFPSGATIEFGHLQYEHDKYSYQGPSFQFIGMDEVTHFTETQYKYLISRLRRPVDSADLRSRVPLRMRAASNPPDEATPGWYWVKRRFVDEGIARGIPFIPSGIDDNPFIDQEEYHKALSKLDPVTRLRLEEGRWDVTVAGRLFAREWFSDPIDCPPADLRLCRFWDMAHSDVKRGKDPDFTAGCLLGLKDGQWFLLDMRRARGRPSETEALVKRVAAMDGAHVRIRMEQEPAGGVRVIDHFARNVLVGYDFQGVRAGSADPLTRWGPVSAASERGLVRLVRGAWHSTFFDEIEAAPNGAHDDQLTAWAGAHAELALGFPDPEVF